MGYSNEDTEHFKEQHKEPANWKYEMSMIELNKLGQEGWELISLDSSNQIYLKRLLG